MNEVYQWFSGLATIGGFLYVLLGFGLCHLVYWIRCKLKHHEIKLQWRLVGIAIGIMAIFFSSLQSQASYSTAKETSLEVQKCWTQFIEISNERAKISEDNDFLSTVNREMIAQKSRAETYMWVHLILPADPKIAELEMDDPARQMYGITLVDNYAKTAGILDNIVDTVLQVQHDLQVARKNKKLPPPTCGT